MEIFIGIDQTGAASSKGRTAKPLPICIAFKQKSGIWQFITEGTIGPLRLTRFHPELIVKLFEELKIDINWGRTAFILDCVLGLPDEVKIAPTKVKPYLWGLFYKAAGFTMNRKEFGREVAEAFFTNLISKRASGYPKRFCEKVSGSNSVFQTHPFQKNIQTGTFRLWKDLGSVGKPWARIWPFEKRKSTSNKPWIFEGYPSLIWKDCLQSSVRDSKQLKKLSQRAYPKFEIDTWKHVEKSPDHADSFVLAFGGVLLQEKKRLWRPSASFSEDPNAAREGWILGLKHPRDI